ncbi:MAG: helix-turn-helix domain-containing protein [Acidimicrobiia bacterium]|nr:helix-turn-helix domain-containing protein [Acidimicrobiia bacterium]
MKPFPHNTYCPYFQDTFELLGKRWTAAILRALFSGRSRFVEIVDSVPGLSNRLLVERLNELIAADVVLSCDGREGGYALTERGKDLRPILKEVEDWNRRWIEEEIATEGSSRR